MKLYSFQHSPNCRRVRMFLAEKNVEIPIHEVDLMQGEQFADAVKAVNPRCIVPVLETDEDATLCETVAIMYYLEQRYPEPALFGQGALSRAQTMMWEHRAEVDGFGPTEDLIRNGLPMLAGRAKPGPQSTEQIPALAERGRVRLLDFYRELDGELSGREFLAGDTFSVADITMLTVVDFAGAFGGVQVPETLEHFIRWHTSVSSRPSAKA